MVFFFHHHSTEYNNNKGINIKSNNGGKGKLDVKGNGRKAANKSTSTQTD